MLSLAPEPGWLSGGAGDSASIYELDGGAGAGGRPGRTGNTVIRQPIFPAPRSVDVGLRQERRRRDRRVLLRTRLVWYERE